MGVVYVQGFFMLVNEGHGVVVWEEGSLRPIVLIFYCSHQGLRQKNSLGLEKWLIFGLGGIPGKD